MPVLFICKNNDDRSPVNGKMFGRTRARSFKVNNWIRLKIELNLVSNMSWLPARFKLICKNIGRNHPDIFPIRSQWEQVVAIVTTVLVRHAPKPNAAFPSAQ